MSNEQASKQDQSLPLLDMLPGTRPSFHDPMKSVAVLPKNSPIDRSDHSWYTHHNNDPPHKGSTKDNDSHMAIVRLRANLLVVVVLLLLLVPSPPSPMRCRVAARTIFFFVSLRAPCDVATRRAGLE